MKSALVVSYIMTVLLPTSTTRTALRIIDGRDAVPGEYPYAVRIETHTKTIYADKFTTSVRGSCTGAALTATWTLTAEHCTKEGVGYTKIIGNTTVEMRSKIRYGNPHVIPSKNKQLCAVLRCEKPNFRRVHYADIALLNTEPILIESYGKVSAIDYSALRGHEVALIGFGLMRVSPSVNDFNTTIKLDKPLQIIDKAMLRSCDPLHPRMRAMGVATYFCATPVCDGEIHQVLYGDSGGPVIHASGIIGVNTGITDITVLRARDHMKRITKPNVEILIPVTPFLDWIMQTTAE